MKENTIIKRIMEIYKNAATWFQSMEQAQQVCFGVSVAAVMFVMIAVAVSDSARYKEISGTEHSQVMENFMTEEISETEAAEGTEIVEETESTEMTESVPVVSVSISTTSIQKDLKIKIADENNRLISGFPFTITVTPVGQNTGKQYTDDDMDGIIHIKSIDSGNYTVLLQEMEGVQITENPVAAVVKEKIAYQKVEIENEVKNESEIDVSREDTADKNIKVENEIQDTLPLLESKVMMTEVAKEQVDLSQFADAAVSHEQTTIHLEKKQIVEDSSGNGADSTEMPETEEPESETEEPETETEMPETEEPEPETEIPETEEPETETEMLETVSEVQIAANKEPGTATRTQAAAIISLPERVQLYPCGKETSTMCEVVLHVEDASNIIREIRWNVSDENIVDVVVTEDNKLCLSAKAIGETRITAEVSYQASETEILKQELTCIVNVGEYTEDQTQLKDMEGNLLYADAKAEKIATQKDYAKGEIFYTNPQYTGWQTFDGKLYYYTEEYIPAIGMHYIGGVKYEFNQDGSMIEKEESVGIDVSKWQGEIDWKAVADAGIDFAIIRCGYRGSESGVLVEDPKFHQNIKGAAENGIKVGVYVFSQAITEAEAVEEASMAISMAEGYQLQFPIFIDTEEAYGRADRLSKNKRTEIVKAFCETIKNAGYQAGIYASKAWFYDNLHASQLSFYHIWVAQYNTECNYTGRFDMWQYSKKGKIPGIKEKVDMNICYTKY